MRPIAEPGTALGAVTEAVSNVCRSTGHLITFGCLTSICSELVLIFRLSATDCSTYDTYGDATCNGLRTSSSLLTRNVF